jgi:galactoside O-acetyltransferase
MGWIKAILVEIRAWLGWSVRFFPGRVGNVLRLAGFRAQKIQIGKNIRIGVGVVMHGGSNVRLGDGVSIMDGAVLEAVSGRLTIGNDVSINRRVCLDASNGGVIELGNDVLIGPNVVVRAANHEFNDPGVPIRLQGHRAGKILVQEDVWVGANAVLLAGVQIGKSSVVGAGAVVTRDVPPYSVVGGVPAVVIGSRPHHGNPLRLGGSLDIRGSGNNG